MSSGAKKQVIGSSVCGLISQLIFTAVFAFYAFANPDNADSPGTECCAPILSILKPAAVACPATGNHPLLVNVTALFKTWFTVMFVMSLL